MNSSLAIQQVDNQESPLEEAKRHILFQHNPSTSDGYITLAKKENGHFRQYHYKPDNLAEHLTEWLGYDVYYSQNTFYRCQRRIENIRQLKSLYVDLDIYNKNLSIDWVLGKLELEYYRQSIPEPNAIIHSGRGLVLIWLIEPIPYKGLSLWQAVQNYLIHQLEEFSSDPKSSDAARVFRLAGSVNSKNGAPVHVEYLHSYRYTLRDLQYDYLPELTPKKEKPKRGRKKKIVRLFNTYSLHHARIIDITKLIELRDYEVTGYRETICFLYRYWMCCFCNDTEEAYRQTLELNDTFTNPLHEKELKTATRSAEKAYNAKSDKLANEIAIKNGYPGAGYNISNAKLIKWLDITQDEMVHMTTIINPKEKRRRDLAYKENKRREAGIRTKEERLKDDRAAVMVKVEKIKSILEDNPNISIRALSELSGIPKSTVSRLKKMI